MDKILEEITKLRETIIEEEKQGGCAVLMDTSIKMIFLMERLANQVKRMKDREKEKG